MPQHLNHHIHVDANGAKTATNQFSGGDQTNIQLQPGDTVTFTSNRPDTEILYKEFTGTPPPKTQSGSPFRSVLRPGTRHKVSNATIFTVETACNFDSHFICDCGHNLNGVFSVWSTLGNDQAGVSTPGPND